MGVSCLWMHCHGELIRCVVKLHVSAIVSAFTRRFFEGSAGRTCLLRRPALLRTDKPATLFLLSFQIPVSTDDYAQAGP